MTVMRAAIVYNPTAARLVRLRRIVAQLEKDRDFEPTLWIATTDAGPADSLVRRAVDEHCGLVIAAGGDGTVRAVGAALAGYSIPFGIVPLGTGNLLARNLGLPLHRLERAVEIAFTAGDQRLDLGTVDYTLDDGSSHSKPYFVMAGFGVDADMVADTKTSVKARLGWVAYVTPILRSLWRAPVDTVSYSLDGAASVTATAHSFIVGNGGTITAGIRLLPLARLDDGLLDVLVLRSTVGRDRSAILRWLVPYTAPFLRGRPIDDDAYRYASAREVTATLDQPTLMQADGDLLGRVTSARFTISPGALRVHAPAPVRAPVRVRPLTA
jgi:YegS/Rv2252/BmrU family lipid kinase